MTPTVNRLLGGLALVALVSPAYALTPDPAANPYQVVVERNVFGLKPAPRPEDLIPPPAPTPPIQVKLQGITEGILGGKRQVLMKIMEPPSKPGTPPAERGVIMDEGERLGSITVLAIDPVARSVKLDNNGTITNLMLTDFITRAVGPMPGAAPGVVPPPGIPGRPAPLQAGVPQPGAGIAPPTAGFNPVVPNVPQRPVRTTTSPASAQRPLSVEEQMLIMEVERKRTEKAVAVGDLPPLPPTPLTPPDAMPPSPQ
jgi:hypothetical protein